MKTAQPRPGGRPTREGAATLTRQILDDARAAFAKKGVANASIEEIAARQAISKHTLYRRYPNKQALLAAVVERDLTLFRAEFAQAAKQHEEPLLALHAVAFRYFLFGTDRFGLLPVSHRRGRAVCVPSGKAGHLVEHCVGTHGRRDHRCSGFRHRGSGRSI